MLSEKHSLKLTFIFLCLLFVLSCIITSQSPASGYELSIYSETPFLLWIFLMIGIFGASLLIINQIYLYSHKDSKFWILCLCLIILFRLLLLYIPYIRGYFSWRGDNIDHVGLVYDILSTSHISSNFYPVTHILISEIILITNFGIIPLINYVTALFSIYNIIGLYLLSTCLFSSSKIKVISTITAGTILFNTYNVYLMPNGLSVLYLPFVFYFYFKSLETKKSVCYKILLVIVILLYPFFHPVSTTIIVLYFFVIGLLTFLMFRKQNKCDYDERTNFPIFTINVILLEITIFLLWILAHHSFDANIIGLYNSLISGTSPDVIAGMGEKLDKINVHGLELIKLVLKSMGDELIYLLLSFYCFLISIKSKVARKEDWNLLILISMIFFPGLFYFLYIFNIIPGMDNIGAERFLAYFSLFTPICGAYIFNHIVCKNIKYIPIAFVVIVILPSIISISSLYESPYTMRPNQQVTQMDISSTKWFLKFENSSVKPAIIMSPLSYFSPPIIGRKQTSSIFKHNESKIPDHFNYTNHNYLGNSYDKQNYIVIQKFDIALYTYLWTNIGRFSYNDFKKLDVDCTVDKIYSNGESTFRIVHPIGVNINKKTSINN